MLRSRSADCDARSSSWRRRGSRRTASDWSAPRVSESGPSYARAVAGAALPNVPAAASAAAHSVSPLMAGAR
jgi:hypothetical protein